MRFLDVGSIPATSTIGIYDFGDLEKKTTSDMDVVDES
jgi:hypothetical protein